MSYVKPDLVMSPKSRIKDLEVIYDGKEAGWSLAKMKWDGRETMGLRWNGGKNDPRFGRIGNPQSRGVPTWFVLPPEVAKVVINMLKVSKKISS